MAGKKATTTVTPGEYALSVNNPGIKHPKSWVYVSLLDVSTLATGHTPSRKYPEYWGGNIPWMSVGDARKVDGRSITKTKQYTNQLGIDNSAAVLLPKDTVCLSRTASIGYAVRLGTEMATSQGFVNFICSPILLPKFLQSLFLAERKFLYSISEGTAHTTIYYPEVKAFNIALPPLAEQKRIVAKLDTIFKHLDALKTRLDNIPKLLKNFRQAVLTQAVTGKLTEEWRIGKELEEWKEGELGDIGIWKGGGTPSKAVKKYWMNGDVLWITPKDMKSLIIVDSIDKITKESVENSSANYIDANSILIVTRSGILRRILPISMNSKIATVNQDIKVLTLNEEFNPKFILYVLRGLEENIRYTCMKSGTTVESVEFSTLKKYLIKFPKKKEQTEIVKRVEHLFVKADTIEAQYKTLKTKIDSLPQAILAKAFKGELVEQLDTDGDAKVLLEEIQKLKTSLRGTKQSQRKKKKD
jgi:type I restriction enzyme S subunit